MRNVATLATPVQSAKKTSHQEDNARPGVVWPMDSRVCTEVRGGDRSIFDRNGQGNTSERTHTETPTPKQQHRNKIKWLSTVDMTQLTEDLGNLESYIDLALVLGPRSTEAVRVDHSSQFFGMAGEGEGGQLSAVMRKFYFPDGNAPSPTFIAGRLATFLTETRWPKVLTKEYGDASPTDRHGAHH